MKSKLLFVLMLTSFMAWSGCSDESTQSSRVDYCGTAVAKECDKRCDTFVDGQEVLFQNDACGEVKAVTHCLEVQGEPPTSTKTQAVANYFKQNEDGSVQRIQLNTDYGSLEGWTRCDGSKACACGVGTASE